MGAKSGLVPGDKSLEHEEQCGVSSGICQLLKGLQHDVVCCTSCWSKTGHAHAFIDTIFVLLGSLQTIDCQLVVL